MEGSKASITADGVSTSKVTGTLVDANGNPQVAPASTIYPTLPGVTSHKTFAVDWRNGVSQVIQTYCSSCHAEGAPAQQLTGLSRPEEICDLYLSFGCQVVALTMGKNGTMVATPAERQVIPARPVQALDATGAGDTFDGAFLAEWLKSGDPFAAAHYANAAAALSTSSSSSSATAMPISSASTSPTTTSAARSGR